MSDRKIRVNEGMVKKGNTSPPPAQSRPQAPKGQSSSTSDGSNKQK